MFSFIYSTWGSWLAWGWSIDMFYNCFVSSWVVLLWLLEVFIGPTSSLMLSSATSVDWFLWWVMFPPREALCWLCLNLFCSLMYSLANLSFKILNLCARASLRELVIIFKCLAFIFLFDAGSPSKKFSGSSIFYKFWMDDTLAGGSIPSQSKEALGCRYQAQLVTRTCLEDELHLILQISSHSTWGGWSL